MKGRFGTEDSGSPTVADMATNPLDGRAIQKVAKALPNPPQCGINPSMHLRVSVPMGRVTTPWCQDAVVYLKSSAIFSFLLA